MNQIAPQHRPSGDESGLTGGEPRRIMVVDEDPKIHTFFSHLLKSSGLVLDFDTSGIRALRRVQRGYAVVVSALHVLDMDGVELLKRIKQVDANIEVIIIGSSRSEEVVSKVMRQGAMAYLIKPFESKTLIHRTVRRALDRWRDTRNDERLYRDIVSGLVGTVDIGGNTAVRVPFERVGFPLIDLLSMMNDGFVFLDDNNRITFSNVKFSRKINWPYRSIFQKQFIKYVLREDRAEFDSFINQIRVERRTGIHETRMVNRIGQVIQIMLTCRLIEIESGEDVILLVITDITEQREAQERARRLATLVDRARFEAILVFDEDSNIIHCNKAAEEMFGYPEGKLIGTKLTALFHLDLSGDAIFKGDPGDTAIEMNALDLAGNSFPVEISESEDNEGRLGSRIGMIFARDIRKRKQSETGLLMVNQQLKKMYEDLLEAQSIQRRFFANMSHELKTPLNTIGGYASLMRDGVGGVLSEKHIKWVESIKTQSNQLLRMIQEILEFAKLDSNKSELTRDAIDPGALVTEMKTTAVALLADKQVSVETEIHSKRGEIMTDGDRLRQVLMNLLGNAAKFTEKGVIRISLRDEAEKIAFVVSDTGCGIPEEEIGKIFDDFYQVEGAVTRTNGSAGLGLAIVKRLVESLGGDIKVESELGGGSEFTILLPVQ